MEIMTHSLVHLFMQLGLPSKKNDILQFVKLHAPLASDIELHQATFWSVSQASFLQESKADDADWAEIVDQLDAMLRE